MAGGVRIRLFSTASRQVMKLTELMITPPPINTHMSSPSSNTKYPNRQAHNSCRKLTGCVTVTGAAAKASVIV